MIDCDFILRIYRYFPAAIIRVAQKTLPALLLVITVSACSYINSGMYDGAYDTHIVASAESPDGALSASIVQDKAGAMHYSVSFKGKPLITNSLLGLELRGDTAQDNRYRVIGVETSQARRSWELPWGETQFVKDHHNELLVNLQQQQAPQRKMNIRLRVFNDGLGFRYELPSIPVATTLYIDGELTEFKLADRFHAWSTPALQAFRYEYLYDFQPVQTLKKVHTPLTLENNDDVHISIHEAALTDFASMILVGDGKGGLRAELVPRSGGGAVKFLSSKDKDILVTPWRTVQVSDNAARLVESTMLLNLNDSNALADIAWIQPGKYVGVWWEMHRAVKTWGSGPAHGSTTENTIRHIDFAARHGFTGVLVEGWNVGWDGNWLKNRWQFSYDTAYDDFDLEYLSDYAKQRGVGLVLQNETAGGVANYQQNIAEAFKKYKELGIIGVKTGYVAEGQDVDVMDRQGNINKEWHHGQAMVNHFRDVVKEAAANHLMIIAHEPIKDTGIRRTYPTMMTREAARGQEYNAWSEGNPPEHTTILPFTRMLSGPMDFTPGIFDLLYKSSQPEKQATSSIFENEASDAIENAAEEKKAAEMITRVDTRVHTTLAKQLALYVVIYSPLQMVPDFPENYQDHPMFQFVVDVPVDWSEIRGLNGKIGDYFTVARKDRHSDDWYIGSVTDEVARKLDVSLDFLTPGVRYTAEIYRDAHDTDWKTNPQAYTIERREVTSADSLSLNLAAGGGQAIRLRHP